MPNNKLKIVEGALVGAVLGVVAGVLLAPKSGKELRSDLKEKAADFYQDLGVQVKKLKNLSEKEYGAMVTKAMATYSKAKKLTQDEAKAITKEAKNYWKQLKKHA